MHFSQETQPATVIMYVDWKVLDEMQNPGVWFDWYL
jgi:hypothetical protein